MKKLILGSLLLIVTGATFAENVINTQTNSWKSVPITVDPNTHTYSTSEGYLMPEGDYYYTYSGFRCLKSELKDAGTEALVYKDKNAEENVIYCYPDK